MCRISFDAYNLNFMRNGARSRTSLVISSVWKPYMKHNCKLDDLGTGFEIAEGPALYRGAMIENYYYPLTVTLT